MLLSSRDRNHSNCWKNIKNLNIVFFYYKSNTTSLRLSLLLFLRVTLWDIPSDHLHVDIWKRWWRSNGNPRRSSPLWSERLWWRAWWYLSLFEFFHLERTTAIATWFHIRKELVELDEIEKERVWFENEI